MKESLARGCSAEIARPNIVGDSVVGVSVASRQRVAFAVTDAWQGRCLGAVLADVLAGRARELGMGRVRASMLANNHRSRALMRRMGRIVARRYEGGSLELEVTLD